MTEPLTEHYPLVEGVNAPVGSVLCACGRYQYDGWSYPERGLPPDFWQHTLDAQPVPADGRCTDAACMWTPAGPHYHAPDGGIYAVMEPDAQPAPALREALERLYRFGYQPMYNGRPSCPFCSHFIDAEDTHSPGCILRRTLNEKE